MRLLFFFMRMFIYLFTPPPPTKPTFQYRESEINVISAADFCLVFSSGGEPLEKKNRLRACADCREKINVRVESNKYKSSVGHERAVLGDVPPVSVHAFCF